MDDVMAAARTLVERSRFVQVGSVDGEGFPWVKAMLAPRLREGMRVFWLTTNTSSRRVGYFAANSRASLYFFDGDSFEGVLLTGHMAVLQDQDSKDRIWEEGDDSYYPLGRTDPDYCVLRFTAEKGRYYRDFASADFFPASP